MTAKTPEGRKLTGQKAASTRWNLSLEAVQAWDPKERRRVRDAEWRERTREHQREYFKQYRAEHAALKEYHAKYYQENKSKWKLTEDRKTASKAQRRVHAATNRAALRLKDKEWRAQNPERAREIAKRTRAKNFIKKRLTDAEYRRQNPEIYKASIARAKAAKPELYREISVKSALVRRARKKELPVEPVSLKAVRARDLNHCHLCGGPVKDSELSFDHLIPVVRKGAHAEWNLMVAHLRCNKSRGAKQLIFPETREAADSYRAAKA
jgi:5-methylcytosine-specific restriction endonuclease McrA